MNYEKWLAAAEKDFCNSGLKCWKLHSSYMIVDSQLIVGSPTVSIVSNCQSYILFP